MTENDNMEEIELELDEDLYQELTNLATEKNISLDDLINRILKERIEKES